MKDSELEQLKKDIKIGTNYGWHSHLGSNSKCQCQYVVGETCLGAIATININDGKKISDGGNDSPPLEEAQANARRIANLPNIEQRLLASQKIIDLVERMINETPYLVDHDLKSAFHDFAVKYYID